jgi:hypothetical protein
MKFLKVSTAAVVPMGPFLDKTDGITLKADATCITDIDHATTGIFLIKNGTTGAIRHQNVTASVADAYGMMLVTLDTTDTNTLGRLRVCFAKAATYLPVWEDFQVLPAAIFDSLVTGTGGAIPNVAAGAVSGLPLNDASNAYTPKQVYDKVSGLTFTAAGKVDANALAINGVATTSVTTVNAVVGTTVGIDVAATGEVGLDFNNIKDATGAHTLTNITVPTVTAVGTLTTYTGNTPQSGDNYTVLAGVTFPALVGDQNSLVSLGSTIGAISAKTVKMTFTSGNDLDVNIQKVNDVALTGNGSTTPWGPV